MSFRKTVLLWVMAAMATALPARAQSVESPVGRWDASVTVNGVDIPFRLDIGGTPEALSGTFFDGDLRVQSSSGRIDGTNISIAFDQYGTSLQVVLVNGRLEGRYDRGTRGAAYTVRAARAATRASIAGAPDIAGTWIIPTTSTKGEQAFRFIVRQQGSDVAAAILRVDGDTGTLSGSYTGERFVLSHFSGARPSLVEVTLASDGSLDILQNHTVRLKAVREADARFAGKLTFEESAQLSNPRRVRAFAQRYDIRYPILLAGEPDELAAKLPQFENLNAFPTTFYLGRDGRVRFVHAGFPSPASGAFYQEAREHLARQVERLLSEK